MWQSMGNSGGLACLGLAERLDEGQWAVQYIKLDRKVIKSENVGLSDGKKHVQFALWGVTEPAALLPI